MEAAIEGIPSVGFLVPGKYSYDADYASAKGKGSVTKRMLESDLLTVHLCLMQNIPTGVAVRLCTPISRCADAE